MYETGIAAPHDGSGAMTYISKSIFSIGEINSVKITNIGRDYIKIPLVTGIVPTSSYLAKVSCTVDSGRIIGVSVDGSGSNYSKPIVLVEGNAKLSPVVDGGKITGIVIDDAGSGYITPPTITAVSYTHLTLPTMAIV